MTYSSNYKQQKPLSKRLKVEQPLNKPDKVKQRKPATAKKEGFPVLKPIRSSGKSQGIEDGTAADVKDYLLSQGETSSLSGWEAHAAQLYADGNDEALDCF